MVFGDDWKPIEKKGKHLNIQQFPVPDFCAKRWILLSWIADVTEHFDKFYLNQWNKILAGHLLELRVLERMDEANAVMVN